MCWGCVVYDGSATDYNKTVTLLTLCGLSAMEIAHVNPSWVHENRLVIPGVWGCCCRSCKTRLRTRALGGPWRAELLRARVIDLQSLGSDGEAIVEFLRNRSTQMSQGPDRIAEVVRRMGFSWDGLRRWSGVFLTHRYGIHPNTIMMWNGVTRNVYLESPFPGYNLILKKA